MEISFSDLQVLCVPRPTREQKEDELWENDDFTPPIPQTVIDGRYEVVKSLGSGAMGSVFLVKHVRLSKLFALKMVNPNLAKMPEFVSRFEREADACSRLTHPNCISVTDFGQASDGTLYLVMEYAEGIPLSEILAEGPVPVPEAIEYTRQILLGLKHAHEGGLIHRDIKLENVIKCQGDSGQINLKILDFGMAKERPSDAGSPQVTRDGLIMGTPHYMAPEQVGQGQVDARVDLYAAGVTLFRLITGRPVFEGTSVLDVFTAKLKNRAPTLEQVTGTPYPEPLEQFVAKALEKDPDDRFATAGEMLDALEQAAMHVPGMPGSVDWTSSFIRAEHIEALRLSPPPPAEPAVTETETENKNKAPPGSFREKLRAEWSTWFHCRELGDVPCWPLRLKGLWVTATGRTVFIRALALLVVVTSAISLWVSESPKPPSDTSQEVLKPIESTQEAPPIQHRLSAAPMDPPPEPVPAPQQEETATEEEVKTADEIGAAEEVKTAEVPAASDAIETVQPILMEAALLIEENKCRQAKKTLAKAKDQTSARAFYLKGRIHVCISEGQRALAFYRKAIAKDAAYRTDTRLLEDAKKMVSNQRLRLKALDFMAELGKPALPTLIHLAESHLSKDVRKRALKLVEKRGALEHVDMSIPLELDLNQARSCQEKRDIVCKLGELNTKRAKQVLMRARDATVKDGWFKRRPKHECVRNDIIQVLKTMKKAK